ncbi:hypothetical protein E2C01_070166 [Portunus trituberculatus]|uniref:Uncharacterized protein n=1 Tax=Portunus trituberculatus TaxID=210409 RepID=A0A5B7HS00_PORTR|nr:hypothetical protein [Portunus trituberculatus]
MAAMEGVPLMMGRGQGWGGDGKHGKGIREVEHGGAWWSGGAVDGEALEELFSEGPRDDLSKHVRGVLVTRRRATCGGGDYTDRLKEPRPEWMAHQHTAEGGGEFTPDLKETCL